MGAGDFDNANLSKELGDMKVKASNKDTEVKMEVGSVKIEME